MLIEVIILGIILFVLLQYNGTISTSKFFSDNQDIFMKLKDLSYN